MYRPAFPSFAGLLLAPSMLASLQLSQETPVRAHLTDPLHHVAEMDVGPEGAEKIAQEVPPRADGLSAVVGEGHAMLELVRCTLKVEGPDSARELLGRVIAGLTDPSRGADESLLDYLIELDTLAEELGSLEDSKDLWEVILSVQARRRPTDTLALLGAQQNLARACWKLGDLHRARELSEEVLTKRSRLLPADHREVRNAKLALALMLKDLGDLQGARELEEDVLAACRRLLPYDDPDVLAAELNLAGTRFSLGDLAGARELEERVLSVWTRILPDSNPDLIGAKRSHALTLRALGDLEGARKIEQELLAARAWFYPADHPDIISAKQNHVLTLLVLGDHQGARELCEEVLAARTRRVAEDHPDLISAKLSLGLILKAMGDIQGAYALGEEVLAARSRLLPEDHIDVLLAKLNLGMAALSLGDSAGTCEVLSSALKSLRMRASAMRSEAPRVARDAARVQMDLFSAFLCLSAEGSCPGLELFATLESLRAVAIASSEVSGMLAEHPAMEDLARTVHEKRTRLSNLASTVPEEEEAFEEWRRSLFMVSEERDRAEHELREQLAEAGAFVEEIDAISVAARLSPHAAVVSFLRYPKQSGKDLGARGVPVRDSLVAFVVRPDATVQRVELGPVEDLEVLVGDWRDALGRPLAARGGGRWETSTEAADPSALGERLRQRILDPIIALVPDARTLHLVVDDLLYLVPLDALPFEGGLFGEHFELRNHATLAELLHRRPGSTGSGFLAAGGIDYDAEPGASASARLDAATPPLGLDETRSATPVAGFLPLSQSRDEAVAVAVLYEQAFEQPATILSGKGATKAALYEAVPGARFLHVATHGWFASETYESQLDSLSDRGASDAFQRAGETLIGFAPETLCGLALAGANRGAELSRVPGILTAEELAAFDLRNCELAVLSACETNVGIRRAGQGILSLQTALHAAGARAAITSLWKVDDEATRRLFEIFYTKLWKEQLGKAEALWQAKMALRAEGRPPRDWAGWVLSGEAQ